MLLEKKIVEQIELVKERLKEQGKLPAQDRLTAYYDLFRSKFGPEALRLLDGEELLDLMHNHGNHESLVYWLEFKNDEEFPRIFGSISGGSAYKFKLYKGKDTGEWIAGNAPKNSSVIKVDEAIAIAGKHRDQLILGCELLEKLPTDGSDSDYKDLQEQINELAPDVCDTAWGHKYFSLIFPSKLDDYHNADYGRYHLIKLLQQFPPEPGRYVCAGRFVSIAKELSLHMNHLTTVLNEIDGNPHRYWRIGTRAGDSGESYWESMRDGNYVSIGWSELNDLSELLHDQRSKDLLKGLMRERSYPNDPATAGRKATEVFNFATTMAKDDIVVASDGSTVLGIGKVIGDYSYKPGLPFAHCRAVKWLSKDEWKTNVKEGLRTTVREIKNPENLVEIERRILGSIRLIENEGPKAGHRGGASQLLDNCSEFLQVYSNVARRVAVEGLQCPHIDFNGEIRIQEGVRKRFAAFLENPTESSLNDLWNSKCLALARGGDNVGQLKKKNTIDEVKQTFEELQSSDEYNADWEARLKVPWALRELWGRIKGRPVYHCENVLTFFGYDRCLTYQHFLDQFADFARFYQGTIGVEGATPYPLEVELGQLLNFVFQASSCDLDACDPKVQLLGLEDDDVKRLYSLKIQIDTKHIVQVLASKEQIGRYIDARYSNNKDRWDEAYKWEVLNKLHDQLFLEPFASENVVEKISALKRHNPQSGSFVYWSELDNLKKIAEKEPAILAQLFNDLFAERAPLYKAINDFRDTCAKQDGTKLGTPFFGYVLAAFNPSKHPLYKDSVFTGLKAKDEAWKVKKLTSYSEEMGRWTSLSIGMKYQRFCDLCNEMGAYLEASGLLRDTVVDGTTVTSGMRALDGQDYFFFVTAPTEPEPQPEPLEHTGPKNLIFYGPPGTGKTYQAINRTLELLNADPDYCKNMERRVIVDEFNELRDKGQVEFITFHQAYSYEEFVEGIRPVLDQAEKNIQYELSDGVFKTISSRAEHDPDNKYVLLIDEINRGNISKIFGELITLIEEDKRIHAPNQLRATLPYSKKKDFGVPPNLYIIGTMNTADRSIALLDVALRRRFKFVEFMPECQDTGLNNCEVDGLNLGHLLSALNKKIEILLDRDHQIGHSFFIKVKDAEDQKKTLCDVWYYELIPLFQEYFYNDYERLEHLLGRHKISNGVLVGFVEKMSAENKRSVLGVAFEAGFSDAYIGSLHRYSNADELIVALKAYVE